MNILYYLNHLDQKIFLFLNGMHCPFMDNVMWYISGRLLWAPLYVVIIYFIIRERKWHVWVTIVAIAIMILLSDQLSDLVKDHVQRLRPSHNPLISGLDHTIRGYCGGPYGFVSSHATNSFAIFAFVSLFFARKWLAIALLLWALLISYSRIYLGVHYPGDILGAAVIGLAVGSLMFYTECLVQKKYFKT